jgi:hypothetical protein
MGIQVEFNPDLALRSIEEFKRGVRKLEECIPEHLEEGKTYPFLKSGQRNYWLRGEMPLLQTKGEEKLSLPIASIVMLTARHSLIESEVWTSGEYKVIKVFQDSEAHFNGFARI